MDDEIHDQLADEFESEPDQSPEPEPDDPEPEVDDGSFEIDGQRYTADQLTPYLRFGRWVQQNPDRAEELVAWERGERIMVPAAQPPEPGYQPQQPEPYGYEEDDRYTQLESRLNAYEQTLAQRSEMDAREAVDSGISSFRDAHPELSPDELTATLLHVRDRRWLETIDPNLSPGQRAAEVAARVEEAYRVRYFERGREGAVRSVAKQVRAARRAASAGRAASVARVEPEPVNDQERMNAIVREIRDFQAQA